MGMIQDVLTKMLMLLFLAHMMSLQRHHFSKAVDQGVAVLMINSDIPNFPTPIHGVVGYSQRNGTHAIADWAIETYGDQKLKVGIIEGQPDIIQQRVGGFWTE